MIKNQEQGKYMTKFQRCNWCPYLMDKSICTLCDKYYFNVSFGKCPLENQEENK